MFATKKTVEISSKRSDLLFELNFSNNLVPISLDLGPRAFSLFPQCFTNDTATSGFVSSSVASQFPIA